MYFSSSRGWPKIRPAKALVWEATMPEKGSRLGTLRLTVAAALVAVSFCVASSQSRQTIRIVVPLPPGGAGDIVARQVSERIGRTQPVSIVIENRPGAGTVIGTETVSRAAPDGGTLLLNAPYMLISPQLRKV